MKQQREKPAAVQRYGDVKISSQSRRYTDIRITGYVIDLMFPIKNVSWKWKYNSVQQCIFGR